MIKAIIFDFFGVLVGDGFDFTYRQAGGDPAADRDFILRLLDKTNRGTITTEEFRKEICAKLGISDKEYLSSLSKSEVINHGLLDYILKLRPKYKTAILSNVNRGGLEERVKTEVLDKHFDLVVVSGDVGYIKPEPQIYRLTAEKLGMTANECVFIDDRQGYINGAKAVGMTTILYKNFRQMKVELEEILAASPNN